jgi:dTDP-4-dehydrorhamnose reductase
MKKTKCLIIGGDGLIGNYLFKNLKKDQLKIYKTSRKNKFKTNKLTKTIHFNLNEIKNLSFLNEFNSVIICAGIDGIKNCEKNKKLSQKINVISITKIIDYLNKNSIYYIFFSSTQVFRNPNLRNSIKKELDPQNLYGIQKMKIEKKINRKFGLIIRPAKVIKKNSDIFFKRFVNKKDKILNIDLNYKIFFSDIKKLTIEINKYLIEKKTGIINFSSKKKVGILYLAKNYLENFKKYKIISKST